MPYYYNGSASASKDFQIGETVAAGVKSSVRLLLFQPGYAAETKILGGHPYVGLGWGPGSNRSSVDITLSPLERTRGDSITGGTDLYPFASLAWANGNDNWMTYVTGHIPTGAYHFDLRSTAAFLCHAHPLSSNRYFRSGSMAVSQRRGVE